MNAETSAIVRNTRALAARKRAKGDVALADALDRSADSFAAKVDALDENDDDR